MIGREFARHMEHAEEFDGPQAGKVIYPFQYCPRFEARKTVLGPTLPDCFYCRFADFPIYEPEDIETGICRYPEIQHY